MRNAVIRKKALAKQAFLKNPARIALGVSPEETDWSSYCHQQFFSIPANRAALGGKW